MRVMMPCRYWIALFAAGNFDVDIDEFLAVDDRHAGFFGVGRVK